MPIFVAIAGILLLLFLVIRLKLQAFVALLLVSFLVGAAAGMPLEKVLQSIRTGMGDTLGFIAVVVGLGAMFGQMLEVSGGVERLSQDMIARLGEGKAQWALACTGFMVSIPIFFDVAFIIIVPLVYALTRKTGRSLLYYGIPLVAGLMVTHAFVPPTPGPIAVAELLHADLGWVILFGIIAGIPAAIVAGPVFAKYLAKRIPAAVPEYFQAEAKTFERAKDLPGFGAVVGIILLPLVLIVLNTVSAAWLPEEDTLRRSLAFTGHPFVALIIATLLAFILFGTRRGFSADEVQKIATKALEPAGIIILVTGAGGVFKQVLVDSGVGKILGETMAASALPPLLLAFMIAAIIRIAQGSATVAMITAAGIMSPIISQLELKGAPLGLMVIAIAAGASIMSHVNDSGFWLISRYFGLNEKDTLRTWTVAATLVSLVGFLMVCILALLFN